MRERQRWEIAAAFQPVKEASVIDFSKRQSLILRFLDCAPVKTTT